MERFIADFKAERSLTNATEVHTVQNKKMPQGGDLLICNSNLVRLVDYRWNQLYPSLLLMYEKLNKFGIGYSDGKIVIMEEL